jgi:hypothetical protein
MIFHVQVWDPAGDSLRPMSAKRSGCGNGAGAFSAALRAFTGPRLSRSATSGPLGLS